MASSTGFDPEKGIETIKKTKGRRQLQMLGEMMITPEDSTSAGSPAGTEAEAKGESACPSHSSLTQTC